MRKSDEIALARALLTCDLRTDTKEGPPLHVQMSIPVKRWRYLLAKWNRRGWLEHLEQTPDKECLRFNHAGYRHWENVLSVCDGYDDGKCETRCTANVVVTFSCGHYSISLGHSCCPEVRHYCVGLSVHHYEERTFVTPCTIPLLD